MDIVFNTEKLKGPLSEEIKPFWDQHFIDLAVNKEDVPLCVDYDMYYKLEEAGVFHIFTARADGKLIGYIMSFIKPHIHYSSTPHATVDIYYLDKNYRKQGIGGQFFICWQNELIKMGIVRVITATKIHEKHVEFWERLGFAQTDVMLTKVLQKNPSSTAP